MIWDYLLFTILAVVVFAFVMLPAGIFIISFLDELEVSYGRLLDWCYDKGRDLARRERE